MMGDMRQALARARGLWCREPHRLRFFDGLLACRTPQTSITDMQRKGRNLQRTLLRLAYASPQARDGWSVSRWRASAYKGCHRGAPPRFADSDSVSERNTNDQYSILPAEKWRPVHLQMPAELGKMYGPRAGSSKRSMRLESTHKKYRRGGRRRRRHGNRRSGGLERGRERWRRETVRRSSCNTLSERTVDSRRAEAGTGEGVDCG